MEDDHCDSALPPIELPSANLPLLNFSDSATEVIEDVNRPPLNDLQGQYAEYTSAQLNELNQVCCPESLPPVSCRSILETAERQCSSTPVDR